MKILNPIYNSDNYYFCDFLLPIGIHCRPAMQLRANNLRFFSSPLDWMGYYPLDTIIHLHKTNYTDFFDEYEVDKDLDGAKGMLRVTDTNNHILSIHFFRKDRDVDESQKELKTIMQRRADRLIEYLKNLNSIVLVAERTETKDEMINFLNSFSAIYPNLNIRLMNVIHDETMDLVSYKEELIISDDKLSYIEYTFNDTKDGRDVSIGNELVWGKVLSHYKLNNMLK